MGCRTARTAELCLRWVRKALTYAEGLGLTSRSTPEMGGTRRLWHWAWMYQPVRSRAEVPTCSGPRAGWAAQGARGSAQLPSPSLAAKPGPGPGTKRLQCADGFGLAFSPRESRAGPAAQGSTLKMQFILWAWKCVATVLLNVCTCKTLIAYGKSDLVHVLHPGR